MSLETKLVELAEAIGADVAALHRSIQGNQPQLEQEAYEAARFYYAYYNANSDLGDDASATGFKGVTVLLNQMFQEIGRDVDTLYNNIADLTARIAALEAK